ncbi:hypothetical protein BDS110ZK14_51070 [Bradyrhizobium diazoefficiens]|nr:hypothetical protein XF15B_08420 [Bradyrhizobium diazoefficiens]
MLPFTIEQFLGVFASYNRAIWPMQVLAYLLGGLAFVLVFRKDRWADQIVAGILAAMWAWTGIVYHLTFFATINKLAYIFGALFVVQAAAFVYFGVCQNRIDFDYNEESAGVIGVAFVFYAAAILPPVRPRDGSAPQRTADVRSHAVSRHHLQLRHVAADKAAGPALAPCDPVSMVACRRQRRDTAPRAARLGAVGGWSCLSGTADPA